MGEKWVKVILAICMMVIIIGGTVWAVLYFLNRQEKAYEDETAKQEDEQTVHNLKEVVKAIDIYYENATLIYNDRTGQNRPVVKNLPAIVTDLSLVSQETGRLLRPSLGYDKITPSMYRICDDFKTSNLPRWSNTEPIVGAWLHGIGYYCFDVSIGASTGLDTAPARHGVASQKKEAHSEAASPRSGDF